jgi:hypothetical protein
MPDTPDLDVAHAIDDEWHANPAQEDIGDDDLDGDGIPDDIDDEGLDGLLADIVDDSNDPILSDEES